MTKKPVRIRIAMPKDLIDEIDRTIGPRYRNAFTTDAVEQKLSRERLRRAALMLGGSLADQNISGWESTESAADWVRSLRRGRDQPAS